MLRFLLWLILSVGNGNAQCDERNTCRYNKDKVIPGCYCDDSCLLYGDCCKEYISSRSQSNLKTLIENDDGLAKHSEVCILISEENYKRFNTIGTFMITKCLKLGTRCPHENRLFDLPVSTGERVFVNKECALCNNVDTFEYWSIMYEMPNPAQLMSISNGEHSISDENVLTLIQEGNITISAYYMQPPADTKPRFCFIDPSSNQEGSHMHNEVSLNHQNIVFCDSTFFKNPEVCSIDGCCLSHNTECYDLAYALLEREEVRGDSIRGMRVLVKFNQQMSKDLQQVKTEVRKITYMNKEVGIVFKLNQRTIDDNDLDEYVDGIFMYLQNTMFKLVPTHNKYVIGSTGPNEYFVSTVFKETARLSDSDLTRLFQLKMDFNIELRPAGRIAHGEMRTVDVNDDFLSITGLGRKDVKVSTYEQNNIRLPVSVFKLCHNVTIIVTRGKGGVGVIDGVCKVNREVNHAEKDRSSFIVLVVAVAFMWQFRN